MTSLYLGVIDLPYSDVDGEQTGPRRKAKAHQGKQKPRKRVAAREPGSQTTGDVALILEAKYHVMEVFYEVNEEQIATFFTDAITGALEDLVLGAPPVPDPLAPATAQIENRFKEFLSGEEMNGLVEGVPTRASRRGVNHRLKVKRGAQRPSFIDTGLYESSFKAWTESS